MATPTKRTTTARPAKQAAQPKPLPKLPLLAGIGILVVLFLIFYSGHLFGSSFLWEDFVEQEFPYRTLAASSLAAGKLPFWNPYTFCGMPFLADIQIAFWYPSNMLQSLFVSDGYLSPVTMQWFILLHVLVAGIGMFMLTRKIFKTDDWASLLAAIAYAFGGFMTAQVIHQMIVYQLALFPFVVLLFIRGFDSWRHSLGAGLILGAMYLAGHPQTTLFLTLFLGLLALYEIGYRLRGKDEARFSIPMLVRMAIPVIIAVGIFAVQLLPSQELADLSRRDVMTFEKSVDGSFSFGHILTLILPRLFGVVDAAHEAKVPYWNGAHYLSWETAAYIGVIPLMLGIAASIWGWRRKYIPFLAGMSIFALLFSLGDNFFLYKIFFSLPLFDKLRTPARMMMVFTFSMSILSAVGLTMLLRNEVEKRVSLIVTAGVIALIWLFALGGMLSAKTFLPTATAEMEPSIAWAASLAALPVIGAIVVALLGYMRKGAGIGLAAIALILTFAELFIYGSKVNAAKQDPRAGYREQQQLVDVLKEEQAQEPTRAQIRNSGAILLKRNQGAYDRIQLLEGYNPLVLARMAPEMAVAGAGLDLLNIKWRVTISQQGAGFQPVDTYLPRAKMYYNVVVKPDAEAQAFLKTDASFDFRNTLLVEEQPSIRIAAADPASKATVKKVDVDGIDVDVTTAENGMLFLSEIYYPAWKAYIDGKETKVYRAFTTLRAVEVPKGTHSIVFKYESDAFATGSTITLVTLLASVGALAFLIIRKK